MSKSIMQTERECYVCGAVNDLHLHHIYEGSGRRKKSTMFGCTVYLCAYHHNMSDKGVHFNKKLDRQLKQECQRKWMETYGKTEDDFRAEFSKSYL